MNDEDPDDNKAYTDFFDEAMDKIDLKQLIRDTFLDGFDTVQDYERYGDMFIKVEPRTDTEPGKLKIRKWQQGYFNRGPKDPDDV